MQKYIQTTKKTINILLVNFTLVKFTGALVTIIVVALIKYMISGNLHIEYCEFGNNVALGLLGWTINTAAIGWLSEYLGIKGINFNFKQFLFGFDTMGTGDNSTSKDFKVKLYNAMESGDGSGSSQQTDKGKIIDKGSNDSVGGDKSPDNVNSAEQKDEVSYWQAQTIYYSNGLKAITKPQYLWTKEEYAYVVQIDQAWKESKKNLSQAIKDLQARGIENPSTLGKHSSTSVSENDTKRPFNKD